MRLYIFSLFIQIATVLSRQDSARQQRKCRKANSYEKLYRDYYCPKEQGNLTGSESYDVLLKKYFTTGYRMTLSTPLAQTSCAKIKNNDDDLPIMDTCGFRILSTDVIGAYGPILKKLSDDIKDVLKEFAEVEEIGNIISFRLGCDARGTEGTKGTKLLCAIKFNPNEKEKKRRFPPKGRRNSGPKTQPASVGHDPAPHAPPASAERKAAPSANPCNESEPPVECLPAGSSIETHNPSAHTENGERLHSQQGSLEEEQKGERPHASSFEDKDDERSDGSQKTKEELSSLSGLPREEKPGERGPRTGDGEANGHSPPTAKGEPSPSSPDTKAGGPVPAAKREESHLSDSMEVEAAPA